MIGRFQWWSLTALASMVATPVAAESILFVGNSFTFGAHSPVMRYRPDLVRDLNREGIGGVPALFKTFAEEAGQDWQVSLETAGGRDLAYHYEQKRKEIDRRWDVVVLQGYSTLDAQRPGDPTRHAEAAGLLTAMLRRANPRVRVELMSTWSRADLTYRTASPWRGRPIAAMADDLAAANAYAVRRYPEISGTIPVGQAWNRAWRNGSQTPTPMTGPLSVRSTCGPGTSITPVRRAIISRRWSSSGQSPGSTYGGWASRRRRESTWGWNRGSSGGWNPSPMRR